MTEPHTPRSTAVLKTALVASSLAFIVAAPIAVLALLDTAAMGGLSVIGMILVVVPLLMLAPAPLVFGLIVATWRADPRTADGRRQFRLLVIVAVAIVVGLSSVLALASVIGALPGTYSAVFVLAAVALTAGGIWLGGLIRRRELLQPSPLPPPPSFAAYSTKVRRRVRMIFWTLAIAVSVTATFFAVTAIVRGEEWIEDPAAILNTASLPLIVTGLVAAVSVLNLDNDAQSLLGRDLELRARISRAVRVQFIGDLPPVERQLARDYARAVASRFPLELAQYIFLSAGVVASILSSVLSDDAFSVVNVIILNLSAVTALVLVPLVVRRARRLRSFANALDSSSASSEPRS